MKQNKTNRCNICGEATEDNLGCALMMAFCVEHTTNLTNVTFCKECYGKYVEGNLIKLSHSAQLRLEFE